MAKEKKTEVREAQDCGQENKSLETAMIELNKIIENMENPECSLEESFRLYQDGMKLLKFCNESIDCVEKEIILLEEQQR